jgi:hypothetical protein
LFGVDTGVGGSGEKDEGLRTSEMGGVAIHEWSEGEGRLLFQERSFTDFHIHAARFSPHGEF